MTGAFSARETDILELLCRGCSDKEIAHTLRMSKRTVRTHLERMFVKTGVHARAGLVAIWLGAEAGAAGVGSLTDLSPLASVAYRRSGNGSRRIQPHASEAEPVSSSLQGEIVSGRPD